MDVKCSSESVFITNPRHEDIHNNPDKAFHGMRFVLCTNIVFNIACFVHSEKFKMNEEVDSLLTEKVSD